MSFIFRDRNKDNDLNMIDLDHCKPMMNNNDGFEWLSLFALFTMLKERPELASQYADELKSKNEEAHTDQNNFCCTVRPLDPLKMADAISKPCTCNPFEGYSREEIELLLDYRGKEI